MVTVFSQRKLLFESDKLPAISDIVKFLARGTNDTYLAGI